MKYAVSKMKFGWVGVGIEDGTICATTLSPSREAALEELSRRGADEPAKPTEAEPLVELVRRAANGEHVDARDVVRLVGGTPIQRDVWNAMLSIPRGETLSYSELAQRVGRPGASQAVGQAVGHNPIPVLIPCHRVVAANGGLGGFGGGLPMKRTLLRLEGVAV